MSTIIAMAYHKQWQTNIFITIGVKGPLHIFRYVDFVANCSAIAVTIDSHQCVCVRGMVWNFREIK